MSQMDVPHETPLVSASTLLSSVVSQLDTSKPLTRTQLHQLKLVSELLSGMDAYLDSVSSAAPCVQQPLLKATAQHDWNSAWERKQTLFHLSAAWSAGAYEGNFVGLLTRITRAKKALEIGMFTGTTTVCIAQQLAPGGKVTALEIDPYLDTFTRPLFDQSGLSDKIQVKVGNAVDHLESIGKNILSDEEAFDIIFIDADKPGYKSYFTTILDKGLLKKDGLLVVDNTLYKGTPWTQGLVDEEILKIGKENADAIKEFNMVVKQDKRVEVVVLPVRDGVSLIMRNE
ncbi:related to O-methyltransferase [Melanopsichium pennsylvanicum]|uniref:Related to O-methyltransferase n=2 Tax=Melanopsichium pennsylvanicum TaxID=63383 RepID=A0AAJ5C3M4_9BASI|nr:related to O-methyltransferase [Melanopsichium pennsylvanicum 4]SNX82786.1 related to O-methyltransferase [Melanopsichium pennsylvanicum]